MFLFFLIPGIFGFLTETFGVFFYVTVSLRVATVAAVETVADGDSDVAAVSDSDLWIHCELLRVVTDFPPTSHQCCVLPTRMMGYVVQFSLQTPINLLFTH